MSTKCGKFRVASWMDTVRVREVYVIEMYHNGSWRPCVTGKRPHVYDVRYDACGMILLLDETHHD